MLLWVVAALALAFAAFVVYVRVAPDDVGRWHFDPVNAAERGKGNDYIVNPGGDGADMASPVFAMSPEALLKAVGAVLSADSNTRLLSDKGGFATFVQRSALMAYPDYISVRAVEADGGSALYVYSRSRFGQKDFGVNEKRVLALFGEL